MDADQQHLMKPFLPRMLATLAADEADLVVGSRYVAGAAPAPSLPRRAKPQPHRHHLARRLLGVNLSDPDERFLHAEKDSATDDVAPSFGRRIFKILLDIVLTAKNPLARHEIPYEFRERTPWPKQVRCGDRA